MSHSTWSRPSSTSTATIGAAQTRAPITTERIVCPQGLGAVGGALSMGFSASNAGFSAAAIAPITPAPSTTSGKGRASAARPTKATAAIARFNPVLSVRPAIRSKAWTMIARTAALIPRNSAANQSSRAAKP